MPDLIVIAGLAVAALVVFLIYKAVHSAREAREEWRRGLRTLGFERLDSPPDDVREAILALYQRGKRPEHRIAEVFERRGSSERLFLFDLKDISGDATHHQMMAVFSPRLSVPRLTIFPRLDDEGRLVALVNLLMKKLGPRQGEAVDFPAHPRFARRHFVSGPDPDAIREFLTERRLDRLAELGNIGVEADGDHLTCTPLSFGRKVSRGDHAEIARRIELAEGLLRVLGSY